MKNLIYLGICEIVAKILTPTPITDSWDIVSYTRQIPRQIITWHVCILFLNGFLYNKYLRFQSRLPCFVLNIQLTHTVLMNQIVHLNTLKHIARA